LAPLVEEVFGNFKANFSYSITLPKYVITVHFKTAGVSEVVNKFEGK